ncbi:uncharacterized protein CC84DRAFT_157517 [Paraphaeosphaeria sporulosa]|uniref:Uncharacterized protein n=1 Tax=Paraphaeosphaeria sporulosa TaxID=1460663 RepID=A0A177CZZ7_9PLEO|nr:uncharacterized protein CC84DRAFT_157517 [Paraphaeosphaeria sporulosa]OAG12721.1 hypothetical protein CC84DRAFT_157517 [Paraphaeosphaeria sporulosa]
MLDARKSHLEKWDNPASLVLVFLAHCIMFIRSFSTHHLASSHFSQHFLLSLTFEFPRAQHLSYIFNRDLSCRSGNYRGHVFVCSRAYGPSPHDHPISFSVSFEGQPFCKRYLARPRVCFLDHFLRLANTPQIWHIAFAHTITYHTTSYYSTWIERFERFTSWIIGDEGKRHAAKTIVASQHFSLLLPTRQTAHHSSLFPL